MIAMAAIELFDLSLWRQIQFELPMMLWLLPVPLLVHFLLPARKTHSAALIMPTDDVAAVKDHRAMRGPPHGNCGGRLAPPRRAGDRLGRADGDQHLRLRIQR